MPYQVQISRKVTVFFTTKDTKKREGMRKLIVEEFYLFTLTSYLLKTSCPFVVRKNLTVTWFFVAWREIKNDTVEL